MSDGDDDRRSAEGVLKRAQEQLKILESRGLDVDNLIKRFESAKMSFASGDFHDAEIAAGEIIVLAKATAEMARVSANVAKQEDATRRQVAEAVRAELAKSLPQSPALESFVLDRAKEAFRSIIAEDAFQQAVLGIASDAFTHLRAEIETVTPSDLDGRLAVMEEKLSAEASALSRQAVASLLDSSELADKISAGAAAAAAAAIQKVPAFTDKDADRVAQAVVKNALADFERIIRNDVKKAITQALEEGAYVNAGKQAAALMRLEESIKKSIPSAKDIAESARQVADKAIAETLETLPKKTDFENLSAELKSEVESRISALPTPEELARSGAEAAHEEIEVLSKDLRQRVDEVSSAIDQVAAREVVSPDTLAARLDELAEKMRGENAALVGRMKEEISGAREEDAVRLAALKDELAGAANSIKDLEKRLGQLPPEAASRNDIETLAGKLDETAASIAGLQGRLSELQPQVATKMEFGALADSVDEIGKTLEAVKSMQASLARKDEFEEKLKEYLPASALAQQVHQIVKPQIEETRSSIPELEAIREIARTEAAAVKTDPQELEDRILEKVAPIVGALVGSDQFIANVNMLLSQRIDDVLAARGLATSEELEKLVNVRIEGATKKFATEKDLADIRRSLLQRGGKGEVDLKAAVQALKVELGAVPSTDDILRSVDEKIAEAVAKTRDDIVASIKQAAPAKAPVDKAEVEQIVRDVLSKGEHAGLDESAVRFIAAEVIANTPAKLDEQAVAAIVDERTAALKGSLKAAAAGKKGGIDEAAVKSIAEDTTAEALGQFFKRLPKSPQMKEAIASIVKDVAPAPAHVTANLDPDALRPIVEQIVQERTPAAGEGAAPSPDAFRPTIEAIVREVAPQVVPAGAGVPSEEAVAKLVEGQLMGLLSDPEYIKNIIPVPEAMDMDKIEKIARREGMQAVVQIFDSEEFGKRVVAAIAEKGLGGGASADPELIRKEVRGALVEFMESDLFSEKIGLAITQQMAGAPAGGGIAGAQVESMIKAAGDEVRQDMAQRFEKVEQALPEIVGKIVAEKGGAGGVDAKVIEEKVNAAVAHKVLGDKLDPALIQAEIKNQTPAVVKEIANSDEFKIMIDDKFKVIMNYLKQDVIPKQVKKALKEGK